MAFATSIVRLFAVLFSLGYFNAVFADDQLKVYPTPGLDEYTVTCLGTSDPDSDPDVLEILKDGSLLASFQYVLPDEVAIGHTMIPEIRVDESKSDTTAKSMWLKLALVNPNKSCLGNYVCKFRYFKPDYTMIQEVDTFSLTTLGAEITAQKEIKTLKSEMKEITTQMKQQKTYFESKIDSMNSNIQKLIKTSLTSRDSTHKNDIKTLQDRISQLETKLEDQKDTYETKLNTQEQLHQQLLVNVTQKMKKQEAKMLQSLTDLSNTQMNTQMKQQKTDFEAKINSMNSNIQNLIKMSLTSRDSTHKNDMQTLQDKISQLETKLEDQKDAYETKLNTQGQLQQQLLVNLAQKMKNLETKTLQSLADLSNTNKALASENKNRKKDIQALQEKIPKLEAELKELQISYETKLENQTKYQLDQLQLKFTELKKILKDTKESLVLKVSLDAQLQTLETQVTSKLRNQLNDFKRRLQELKINEKIKTAVTNDNKKDVAILESKLMLLKNQINAQLNEHIESIDTQTTTKINFLMDGIYKQTGSQVNEKLKLIASRFDFKLQTLSEGLEVKFVDFVRNLNTSYTDQQITSMANKTFIEDDKYSKLQERLSRLNSIEKVAQDGIDALKSQVDILITQEQLMNVTLTTLNKKFSKTEGIVVILEDQAINMLYNIKRAASTDSLKKTNKRVMALENLTSKYATQIKSFAQKETLVTIEMELDEMKAVNENQTHLIEILVENDSMKETNDRVTALEKLTSNYEKKMKNFTHEETIVTIEMEIDEIKAVNENQTHLIEILIENGDMQTMEAKLKKLELITHNNTLTMDGLADKASLAKVKTSVRNVQEQLLVDTAEIRKKANKAPMGVLVKKVADLEQIVSNCSVKNNGGADTANQLIAIAQRLNVKDALDKNQTRLIHGKAEEKIVTSIADRVNSLETIDKQQSDVLSNLTAGGSGPYFTVLEKVTNLEDSTKNLSQQLENMTDKDKSMVEKIEKLENVQTGLSTTIDDFTKKEQPVVAFAAGFKNLEKISQGQTLVFDDVSINIGEGYDNTTGTFTAPVSGVYAFHLVIESKVSGQNWMDLALSANGQPIAILSSKETTKETQISINSVTLLKQGDEVKVTVVTNNGTTSLTNGQLSEFNGYLIKYME